MEELRNLKQIYSLAVGRFNQYKGKDFILPKVFKEQVKEINSNTITYNDYSAVIETRGNQNGVLNIFLPNQWFYIASYFTDFYNELQRYKKESLKVASKERLKNLNGATLSDAEEKTRTIEALEENLRKQEQMKNETALYKLALEKKAKEEQMAYEEAIKERERANQSAAVQARNDLQNLLTEIANAEIERENQKREAEVAHAKELAEIEKSKQEAYAATVKEIMSAISPDLIAAISANSKAELLREGMASMSPYAIANGESVADTVNKLMRGTPLEDVLDKASTKINF